MQDMFKAELVRFRLWAIVLAAVHAIALGFLSRLVDMAQQPLLVYQVFGMVYLATGALLGLYQMGTYRRPNHWLNLLHRPMHRLRIAAALCSAGGVLLLVCIALPIALIATYQSTLTARVVDLRHWLLPLAALLIALCGYLAAGYAMLANRRYSWTVAALPGLLLFAPAHGMAALALQAVLVLVLAAMLAIAFKPDLSEAPRGAAAVVVTALPVLVSVYWLLWILGVGYEVAMTLAGTHPLNAPRPPPGGFIEADRADGKDLLRAGIAGSKDPAASQRREQIALSQVFQLYGSRDLPWRGEMANLMPMEFDDAEHQIRWVFSHDRMRFVGRGLLDGQARGELGLGADNAPFPEPVLPIDGFMQGAHAFYQYDSAQQRIVTRAQLAPGEVFGSTMQPAGDNLAVLSDRALYFYPGREAANSQELLQPLLRVPLSGAFGNLGRVDLIELLDGYLVSFNFSWGAWSGRVSPYQTVIRVSGDGATHEVARRDLIPDLPLLYTFREWWLSPAVRVLCQRAQALFAASNPLQLQTLPAPPRNVMVLAAALCLASMFAALWLTRRQALSPRARGCWVLACAAIGVPALIGAWLLFPLRERDDEMPLPQPATA